MNLRWIAAAVVTTVVILPPAAFAGYILPEDSPASCSNLLDDLLPSDAPGPGAAPPVGSAGLRLPCAEGEGAWEGGYAPLLDADWLRGVLAQGALDACAAADAVDAQLPAAPAPGTPACAGPLGSCGLDALACSLPELEVTGQTYVVLLLRPQCRGEWLQTMCYYRGNLCVVWLGGLCIT